MDKVTGSSVVYIDTNIFVYFVEASPNFFEEVKKIFEHIDAVGARIVTSDSAFKSGSEMSVMRVVA